MGLHSCLRIQKRIGHRLVIEGQLRLLLAETSRSISLRYHEPMSYPFLNTNTFEYLKQSQHPRLAECKKYVELHNIRTEFIAESVFDWAAETDYRFDSVFGVGVFATFGGTEFDRLMNLLSRVLKKGGHLVNVSWDGTYYTEKQKREKLKYRFSGTEGPTPDELIDWVEKAGFKLMERRILTTDAQTYKWDSIHVSAFRKG